MIPLFPIRDGFPIHELRNRGALVIDDIVKSGAHISRMSNSELVALYVAIGGPYGVERGYLMPLTKVDLDQELGCLVVVENGRARRFTYAQMKECADKARREREVKNSRNLFRIGNDRPWMY
jgi:hypothetical protein